MFLNNASSESLYFLASLEDVDMENVEMLRKHDEEYQRLMKERAEIQKNSKYSCFRDFWVTDLV